MTNENNSSHEDKNRRGSVDQSAEPRFLVIGQVRKPHGVGGEVRVTPHTDLPERFKWLDHLYVGEKNPRQVKVESVRFHQDTVLVKLAGYNSREQAQALRGQLLQVSEDEAIPLEEGEYFLYQLEGLSVVSDTGSALGELIRIIETGANNVFVVDGPQGEILLPDINEVIREIDFERGIMTVHLLPGLLPD